MPSLRVAAGTRTPLAALVVALVYYLVIKYTKWQPNEERKGQFIPLLFACHQLNVACIMLHGLLMACAPYHANKLQRAACNIQRSETTLGRMWRATCTAARRILARGNVRAPSGRL
jgi:hypothetical protein